MNNQFCVDQSVVDAAAASCARLLAEWFGSEEEAAKALIEDPVAMAQIAMIEFMKQQREMTAKAISQPVKFSRAVLGAIKD